MIKARILPIGEVMAAVARGREADRRVRRRIRAVVIALMALDTRCAAEFVRAARAECRVVALGALQRGVHTGQSEAS